jgi:hypothetical protein
MAKKDIKEQTEDLVAPVESVETAPVEEETPSGPVLEEEVVVRPTTQECWNCKNHGKSNSLDANGVCEECGFDKSILYNLDLEAEKAAARQKQAQAQAQIVLAAQVTNAK